MNYHVITHLIGVAPYYSCTACGIKPAIGVIPSRAVYSRSGSGSNCTYSKISNSSSRRKRSRFNSMDISSFSSTRGDSYPFIMSCTRGNFT